MNVYLSEILMQYTLIEIFETSKPKPNQNYINNIIIFIENLKILIYKAWISFHIYFFEYLLPTVN